MKDFSSGPAPLTPGALGGSTTTQLQRPQVGPNVMVECDAPLAACRSQVLIVDDHPADVEVIARYMVREGHEVVTRTTGPCGLVAFHNHWPALTNR